MRAAAESPAAARRSQQTRRTRSVRWATRDRLLLDASWRRPEQRNRLHARAQLELETKSVGGGGKPITPANRVTTKVYEFVEPYRLRAARQTSSEHQILLAGEEDAMMLIAVASASYRVCPILKRSAGPIWKPQKDAV